MMTWQVALAVAAALFGAFIVWRVRPSFGPRKVTKAHLEAFAAARARVLAATTPVERALALCDAGDARASMAGNVGSVVGYYLRAMRSDPTSAEPIARAAHTLHRRPRTLESLLWRRLGSTPWDGTHRPSAIAALIALERVYATALRNRTRASALRFALDALGSPVKPPSPRADVADRG